MPKVVTNQTRRKIIHEAVLRLSDGDRSAFPSLLEEVWPIILAFAQRGLRHQADAEDVAQEVFVRVCSRISEFDRTQDGLSWIFGIAGYEIMTHRRRLQRRKESSYGPDIMAHAAQTSSQEESLLQRELMDVLAQAVGALSDDDRHALGFDSNPVANDIPGATRRKRRQRALGRLRVLWRKIYGEP